LAFVSEFNVQMPYLPGLKNVVADFLLSFSPLPPLTGDVDGVATAAATPIDFEAMAAKQNCCWKRSICLVVHL
jgi:hypothetical protein